MAKIALAESQTVENLAKAFAGESQARNRYLFYAEQAEKEGYPTLAKVFNITGDNERGHAETFYEYLAECVNSVIFEPKILVPVELGSTPHNLYAAAKGEYFEWSNLYPAFEETARQEGFEEIALSFHSIAQVEKRHDARYRFLLRQFDADSLWTADRDVVWECTNCGFLHRGTQAPDICPACRHTQAFYWQAEEYFL